MLDDEARLLVEIHTMVKQLIQSRDDHESRLRLAERALTEVVAEKRESDESQRRLIAWMMLIAAVVGACGSVFARAVGIVK